MKAAIPLFFFLLGFTLESQANALPLCRDQWRGQNPSFNFQENYASFQQRLHRDKCEKEWTVLVYMAADNDLFPFALWDLYEMEAAFQSQNVAGSTLKTDLVVQVDGPAPDDLRRLHIHSGPVAYQNRVKADFEGKTLEMVKSPVVEKLPENEHKGEQQRLDEFLLWAAEKYPSRHYMVVVWGHGQGWKAYPNETPAKSRFLESAKLLRFPITEAPDSRFGGIAFKKNTNTWLDIPALQATLKKFTAVIGHPVDVYASDACLMQMLEVAYEIAANARFVVGTTQLQSFLGLPYRRILYELNKGSFNGLRKDNRQNEDGTDEPYLLAKMIPQLMKQSLNPRGGGLQSRFNPEWHQFMTSSALTSLEMQNQLLPEVARLSQAIKRYLQEDPMRAMDVQFVMQNVPRFEGSAQDFGVFLGLLDFLVQEERAKQGGSLSSAATLLRSAVTTTKQALDRTVLAYAYGPAYGIDDAVQLMTYVPRAISLWLPVSAEEYRKRRSEFQASRLYRETRWQEWLDIVFPQ